MTSLESTRKKVSVTFCGNDDIEQSIIGITERKSSLRSLKKSSVKVIQKDEPMSEDDESEEAEEDTVYSTPKILSQDQGITGMTVFGFKTNKKSGQMAEKASETANILTPKKINQKKSEVVTPRSSLRKKAMKETPARKLPVRKGKATPAKLRARNVIESDMSSEDSVSSCNSSSSEDEAFKENGKASPGRKPQKHEQASKPVIDDECSEKEDATIKKLKKATPGRKKRKDVQDESVKRAEVDGYFESQSHGTVTSDRTLAKLEMPRMDAETLGKMLAGVELGYKKERMQLYTEYQKHFNDWMYLMSNNFNILLHGVGSKRQLMEDFRETAIKDFSHIVINGFFPGITLKSILNSITEDVIGHSGTFRGINNQIDFIQKYYEAGDEEDLYIIFHNIDGPMLRSEKVQMALSKLACVNGIHFVASIDHINAPLIWDQTKVSGFNWLWYDVTTFDSYTEETSYENSLLVQQSGALALSSLTNVMKSLNPNARKIFYLLAQYQINNKDNQNYIGLAFPDFYQKCREGFLVNSDLTLRTQLTEFKDHKLIRIKRGPDGQECLTIPLEHKTLTEFLEEEEQ